MFLECRYLHRELEKEEKLMFYTSILLEKIIYCVISLYHRLGVKPRDIIKCLLINHMESHNLDESRNLGHLGDKYIEYNTFLSYEDTS